MKPLRYICALLITIIGTLLCFYSIYYQSEAHAKAREEAKKHFDIQITERDGKIADLKKQVEYLSNKIAELSDRIESNRKELDNKVSRGDTEVRRMRATAYDLSVESCGKSRNHPQYGITFSGTRATVGRTVAVDPKVIPLGSRVYIKFPLEYSNLDGVYIAEDTGRLVKGNIIDIFLGEDKPGERKVYESVMRFGVQKVEVYILEVEE